VIKLRIIQTRENRRKVAKRTSIYICCGSKQDKLRIFKEHFEVDEVIKLTEQGLGVKAPSEDIVLEAEYNREDNIYD